MINIADQSSCKLDLLYSVYDVVWDPLSLYPFFVATMGSWSRILGFLHGGNESKRPRFLEIRSARWFILFTVSFAACTVSVVYSYFGRIQRTDLVQDIFMYGLVG